MARRRVGRSAAGFGAAARPVGLAGVAGLIAMTSCSPSHIAGEPGPAYPTAKPLLGSVDVHVLRDDQVIEFTNTSAGPLGPGTLWLNGRYGLEIAPIEPARTARFNLYDFRDEYGGAFRGGGFFALEPPDLLVRAEVEQEDGMVGLVVVEVEGE